MERDESTVELLYQQVDKEAGAVGLSIIDFFWTYYFL